MDGIERSARCIGAGGAGRAAIPVPTSAWNVMNFPDSSVPAAPASMGFETTMRSKGETP